MSPYSFDSGLAHVPQEHKSGVYMGLFDLFRGKQYGDEVGTTVPLSYSLEDALYPEVSYSNFAKEGYGKNEIVHACIRELATSASMPRYFLEVQSSDGGVIELDRGELFDLMEKPNAKNDWASFIEDIVTSLMVSGNVYVLKERQRTTKVSSLNMLRPDRITINGGDYGATSYTYEIGGVEYNIPAEDICHLALPNPSGDLYGLSPLQVLSRTVNLDLNMTDFSKVFFQNAGVPSGLLKIKRRLQSQEEATTIRNRWRSQFGAKNNFHRVAIMDDDAEYQPMGSVPKDLAMNELHNVTESRICAVFGVPPILIGANVGLERATYSNYREARFSFNAETLQPLVNRIIRWLNYSLVPEFPNQGKFSVDKNSLTEMIDDKESNTQRAVTLFGSGLLTLNEARELVGAEAIAEGDVRRVPSNVLELAEGEEAPAVSESLPFAPAPVIGSREEEEGEETEELSASNALYSPKVESDTPTIETASLVLTQTHEKSDLERRAIKLRRMLLLDREALVEEIEPSIERYLIGLKNRVDGVLGRLMERSAATSDIKDLGVTPDKLIAVIEHTKLPEIIYRAYLRITKQTMATLNESAIAGTLDWSAKLPMVTGLLTEAPTRANLIHSTTSKVIRDALKIAQSRGYSIDQLARGFPKDNFRGLMTELGTTKKRATLIARTETMRTQNLTTLGFYKTQEYEYVQATDPDGDANDTYVDPGDPYGRTCIERDGKVYSVEDARDIQDHPNGTLSWMPMQRDYKPTEAF